MNMEEFIVQAFFKQQGFAEYDAVFALIPLSSKALS
jgi:hypothetical protein